MILRHKLLLSVCFLSLCAESSAVMAGKTDEASVADEGSSRASAGPAAPHEGVVLKPLTDFPEKRSVLASRVAERFLDPSLSGMNSDAARDYIILYLDRLGEPRRFSMISGISNEGWGEMWTQLRELPQNSLATLWVNLHEKRVFDPDFSIQSLRQMIAAARALPIEEAVGASATAVSISAERQKSVDDFLQDESVSPAVKEYFGRALLPRLQRFNKRYPELAWRNALERLQSFLRRADIQEVPLDELYSVFDVLFSEGGGQGLCYSKDYHRDKTTGLKYDLSLATIYEQKSWVILKEFANQIKRYRSLLFPVEVRGQFAAFMMMELMTLQDPKDIALIALALGKPEILANVERLTTQGFDEVALVACQRRKGEMPDFENLIGYEATLPRQHSGDLFFVSQRLKLAWTPELQRTHLALEIEGIGNHHYSNGCLPVEQFFDNAFGRAVAETIALRAKGELADECLNAVALEAKDIEYAQRLKRFLEAVLTTDKAKQESVQDLYRGLSEVGEDFDQLSDVALLNAYHLLTGSSLYPGMRSVGECLSLNPGAVYALVNQSTPGMSTPENILQFFRETQATAEAGRDAAFKRRMVTALFPSLGDLTDGALGDAYLHLLEAPGRMFVNYCMNLGCLPVFQDYVSATNGGL